LSRKNAPALLKKMKKILGKKMILGYGTVLWLVRNGRLHTEDPFDDEDIFVLAEDLTEEVIQKIIDAGFTLYKRYPMASGKLGEISFSKDKQKIDIYVAHKQGPWRYWAMWGEETHYYAKIDARFLEDPDTLDWNGETWQVPQQVEDYLTVTYGNWEEPADNFDWRIDHVCYDPHFKEEE